ncbi:MAG: DUF4432 family protein [Rhizobiaceae bacterium]
MSTFKYASGIEALRVKNSRGEIIVLPFKGQQIWRAQFDGRELTMKSMFDEPVDTQAYLETYGAFLIHCGLTGLGAPGPTDNHPLHGELPNAPFQSAWIELDPSGQKVTIAGSYQYTVAFSTNYRATARIGVTAGAALLDVSLSVENLKKTAMDLMYLAHANFRPVDDGELHYSAPYTAEAVRVRQSIPAHISPKPGYEDFIAALATDPAPHHKLSPNLAFDPEIVFTIDMLAGKDGLAHALQKRPDGTADYICYHPDQAPIATRWVCRTPDQDGLGVAFPSTSEVEGYTAEKAKGQVVELGGEQVWNIDMKMGLLTDKEVGGVIEQIESIRSA